jgi:hypothetical protein
MTEELRRDIQRRVHAVQRHYHRGGPALRAVWLIAAFLVIIAGLAMTVLPGPATIVIPIGLAMLAARFRWAQTVLRNVIDRGVALQRRFARAPMPVRLVGNGLLIVTAVWLTILWLR